MTSSAHREHYKNETKTPWSFAATHRCIDADLADWWSDTDETTKSTAQSRFYYRVQIWRGPVENEKKSEWFLTCLSFIQKYLGFQANKLDWSVSTTTSRGLTNQAIKMINWEIQFIVGTLRDWTATCVHVLCVLSAGRSIIYFHKTFAANQTLDDKSKLI